MSTTVIKRAKTARTMRILLIYDTMQRSVSKTVHHGGKLQSKDSHDHISNGKSASVDSVPHSLAATNGKQQRKPRSNNSNNSKRQDGGNNGGACSKRVDDWLGRNLVYCYESRFLSSGSEDKPHPCRSTTHRNSTSSEAAGSDDSNSTSSHEDLSSSSASKGAKKSTKSRQRRQQRRKLLNQTNGSTTSRSTTSEDIAMDVDEETKENSSPTDRRTANQARPKNTDGNTTAKPIGTKLPPKVEHKINGNAGKTKSHVSEAMKKASVLDTSTSSSSLSLSSSDSTSPTSSVSSSPTSSPTIAKRTTDNYKKIARAFAPNTRVNLLKSNLKEQELVHYLQRYIIDPNLLRVYGYPVESAVHHGCIEIYKCLPKPFTAHSPNNGHSFYAMAKSNVINANDGLYANFSGAMVEANNLSTLSGDSGRGSGDSSPPSVDSDASEAGEDESNGATSFYTPDGGYQIFSQYDRSLEKQCIRCKRAFHVTDAGDYLSHESCDFHWGKLYQIYTPTKGFGYQYSCCQSDEDSEGCTHNPLHVWSGAVVGLNGPYSDFVYTRPRYDASHHARKVYALDCEMSFTGRGLEVTKVTVVGYDGELVYEHFVCPKADIVDYNTRFSGVSEKDLCRISNKAVKTLPEVQRDLLQLIDADTILIGHGLDNDLRVLRIVHKTVVDTSISFPHASGFPYRRALKHLTKVCLNRDIQCGDTGHSSYEDSRACLELMLWKMRKDQRQELSV